MTGFWDSLVDRLVGDRCTADPCASRNGLKTRVYAVVFGPTFALGLLSFHLYPHPIGNAVFVCAFLWGVGSGVVIPLKLNKFESCDEVESHYNEDGESA